MIEKAADQSVTPVDIATLYSRASVQGTRYWDFSASREQVRGQFCHPVAREHAEPAQPQVVREQEERAEPQAVTEQAEPAQPQVVREQEERVEPQAATEQAEPVEPQVVREQEERVEPQAVTEQVEPVEPQVLREQEERVEPQAVTEQAERVEPQVSEQAEAVEQPEALPQGQLEDDVEVPQLEPEAGSEEVLMPEADPPGEMHRMTGSEVAEQPTPAGPTLWAGPAAPREESGPAPLVQWPVPRRQGTGSAAGAGGDTLTLPKEGGPSRWYALQSVFAPPQEAVEAPPTSLEQRPPMVLVFSLAGGVGKTCLVATLGRALSALGERVLLADTSSYGLLPFYFGSREFKPQSGGKGVRTFSPPESESDAPVQVLSLEVERCPGNGSEQDPLLGELVRDGRGANRILVDVATGSRDVTSRLLSLQPTLLVPILPDMSSVASLGSLEAFLASAERGGNEPFYLLNQFDASSPLHLDVREMLRRQLGDRLLPLVLRRSSAVSEALAEGMTVIDYAPSSAAAKDYWDLAGWLRSLDAPAAIGYDELRWSERRAQW